MKIEIEMEKIYINATDGDTIIFHESNLTEFSNALMIIRQLKEQGPLDHLKINYGGQPKQRRKSDKGGAL